MGSLPRKEAVYQESAAHFSETAQQKHLQRFRRFVWHFILAIFLLAWYKNFLWLTYAYVLWQVKSLAPRSASEMKMAAAVAEVGWGQITTEWTAHYEYLYYCCQRVNLINLVQRAALKTLGWEKLEGYVDRPPQQGLQDCT